jgi:ABC-type multidrug transport system fused ATPase/permease subunit
MKQTFVRVLKLIKPYIPAEIAGLSLTMVYTSAVFAAPIVSKYLIDEVLPSHSQTKLYFGLIMFFFVCMLQPVAGYVKDIIFLNISENITYAIRKSLFAKIIQAPLQFFDRTPKGEILSRVINDGRSSSEFVSHLFVVMAKNILLIGMILGGMFFLSVQITVIVLAMFALFLFLNSKLSRKFTELSARAQRNFDSICTGINQMLDCIVTIKSFPMVDHVKGEFDKELHNTWLCNKKIGCLSILINNITGIITVFSLCIIYGLGMLLVMSGKTTLGTVMALGLYFQMLIQPVYELQSNNIEYQKTLPIFDRLYEYLELPGEEEPSNPRRKVTGGEIVAENVSFAYHNQIEALDDINLVIPSRGLISLVGRSGSGKSTFIKLLMGFYIPTSGRISIGGQDLLEIGVGALRNMISLVPQEIDLFHCSVKDNIICGTSGVTDEAVVDLCKRLDLHGRISAFPEGYDSIISERANLSGGEKQRIGIARALIKNAPVLIFDEPTAALDPENENIIRNILEDIARERTVIVATHKLSTIVHSNQIIVFDNGKIVKEVASVSLVEQELCS